MSQTPILLPFSLWQTYTQFYLLWRRLGGQVLPTTVCDSNGISRNALGRLRQLGVIAYGQALGAWWPVYGVQVQVMDVDGLKTLSAKRPKDRARLTRHFSFTADGTHLQTVTTEGVGAQVDRAAEAEGVTISEWLRDAVRRKLEG